MLLYMQESLSRYESERGTAGRGTPPEKKDGQPRLDLLLQQTYKYQVGSFCHTQHYNYLPITINYAGCI